MTEEAIQKASEAASITPEDHPDLAGLLQILAGQLWDQYDHTLEPKDNTHPSTTI
jgi:hypothetical protein